jgi:hypothetical protein
MPPPDRRQPHAESDEPARNDRCGGHSRPVPSRQERPLPPALEPVTGRDIFFKRIVPISEKPDMMRADLKIFTRTTTE